MENEGDASTSRELIEREVRRRTVDGRAEISAEFGDDLQNDARLRMIEDATSDTEDTKDDRGRVRLTPSVPPAAPPRDANSVSYFVKLCEIFCLMSGRVVLMWCMRIVLSRLVR